MAALTALTPDDTKRFIGTGPVFQVYWDNNALGELNGSVDVAHQLTTVSIGDSTQYGDTPIRSVITGRGAEVTVQLREWDHELIAKFLDDDYTSDYVETDERSYEVQLAPLLIKGPQAYTKETAVADESVGTGDGSEKTFSGTAVNTPVKQGTFTVTDATETFSDNGDGTLTGSADGTGTISYLDGTYSVTFNAAPTNEQAITADYTALDQQYLQWTIKKAGLVSIGTSTFDKGGILVLPVTFRAHMDLTATAGTRIFKLARVDA